MIKELRPKRPKRATRAKKAKRGKRKTERGKLVQTSGWELAHTRNECSQVSIARSAVKAEREKQRNPCRQTSIAPRGKCLVALKAFFALVALLGFKSNKY